MLFSVSRSSVRLSADDDFLSGCPGLVVLVPRGPAVVRSPFELTLTFPANVEPPGCRRRLQNGWPQLCSDEDLPQPYGLAKRYVDWIIRTTHARYPRSESSGWRRIGEEVLSGGWSLGIASRHEHDLLEPSFHRPLQSSTSWRLPFHLNPVPAALSSNQTPFRLSTQKAQKLIHAIPSPTRKRHLLTCRTKHHSRLRPGALPERAQGLQDTSTQGQRRPGPRP